MYMAKSEVLIVNILKFGSFVQLKSTFIFHINAK